MHEVVKIFWGFCGDSENELLHLKNSWNPHDHPTHYSNIPIYWMQPSKPSIGFGKNGTKDYMNFFMLYINTVNFSNSLVQHMHSLDFLCDGNFRWYDIQIVKIYYVKLMMIDLKTWIFLGCLIQVGHIGLKLYLIISYTY